MPQDPNDPVHRRRIDSMLGLISEKEADSVLISKPGMIAALSGIWLETGEIMQSRNPWLLLGLDGSVAVLVEDVETELTRQRCELERVQMLRYHGAESRCQMARTWITQRSWRRLAADFTDVSAKDMRGLSLAHVEIVDVSSLADSLPKHKSPGEVAMISTAASAVMAAVTDTCTWSEAVGAPESVVAGHIAARIFGDGDNWHLVMPIVSSGSNLRIPHARPGSRRLACGDLCRIGARGKFGPFHIMYTQSVIVRSNFLDPAAEELSQLTMTHTSTPLTSYDQVPPRTHSPRARWRHH